MSLADSLRSIYSETVEYASIMRNKAEQHLQLGKLIEEQAVDTLQQCIDTLDAYAFTVDAYVHKQNIQDLQSTIVKILMQETEENITLRLGKPIDERVESSSGPFGVRPKPRRKSISKKKLTKRVPLTDDWKTPEPAREIAL